MVDQEENLPLLFLVSDDLADIHLALVPARFELFVPESGAFSLLYLVQPDILCDRYEESFDAGVHPEFLFIDNVDKGYYRFLEDIFGILLAPSIMNNKRTCGRCVFLINEHNRLVEFILIAYRCYQFGVSIFFRDLHIIVSAGLGFVTGIPENIVFVGPFRIP